MMKIRKGDDVMVISGRDKGKRGPVLKVIDQAYVIVENVNKVKRHTKPNPTAGMPGGIIDKEMPIDISKVALVNGVTGKPDRVGFKTLEDGRKVRYFKSNGEVLDS